MPKIVRPVVSLQRCRYPQESAAEGPRSRGWFAVYTAPRHEKRVEQHMCGREIEHYLPLYRAQHKWRDGSRAQLDLPLFPSYIFVHIGRNERVRVLNVPGVVAIVGGTAREPFPLPDEEIETLRSGLSRCYAEPHPLLQVGERARICSGPLTGMTGVVVRRKGGLRMVLTVDLIRQSIAVEVDGTELEKLNPPDPSVQLLSAS